ncbi:MAG: MFS transporter [Chloroflexia bacterium]|nr:MFS transporter [Chloroflexia bacterium]
MTGTTDQTEIADSLLDEKPVEEFNARGTATLAGAHAAHDLYGGFLGPLLPAVQEKLGLSLTVVSLMIPAQQLPGVFQPFIGYMADKTSRRWFVVLGPGVTAVSISSIGLAPHLSVVLLLLLVSGLASGAFHAPAVALMGEYAGPKIGRAMAFFMAGAEFSRSLAPIIITAAISWFTLEGAAMVMVFGVASSVFLYLTLDTSASDAARREAPSVDLRPLLRSRRKWIGALVGVVVFNAIATGPFHYFLVKLLVDKGHSDWYAGLSLSTLFAAGVVGMLLGGTLSDRIGRRNTLALASAAAAPMLYAYLWFEDGSLLPLAALVPASIALTSIRPIIMAVAQEMLPEARGSMAGGLLALNFVTSSIMAFAFGAIADVIGIETAFFWIAGASVLALPFIALLPSRSEQMSQAAA